MLKQFKYEHCLRPLVLFAARRSRSEFRYTNIRSAILARGRPETQGYKVSRAFLPAMTLFNIFTLIYRYYLCAAFFGGGNRPSILSVFYRSQFLCFVCIDRSGHYLFRYSLECYYKFVSLLC